MIRHKIDMT